MRAFFPIASFDSDRRDYDLLPFRFMRIGPDRELLVNEVGEFLMAPRGTVQSLVQRTLDVESAMYADLRARHFLRDRASNGLIDILATKLRTKRSFLDDFTQLHIFVVTLRCDHSCHYCQVSRQSPSKSRFDMSQETAERSLSLMMQSPARHLTMEFQGGEPLLNFDLIRYLVLEGRKRAESGGKFLRIVLVSNLTQLADEHLSFLAEHDVYLSTSLDGPDYVHNANRPGPGNPHEALVRNLDRARQALGIDKVAALMTTTQLSLRYPREIVDEYLRLGFGAIFLRPLSPYGFAIKTQTRTGYPMGRFLEFYQDCLHYILERNLAGKHLEEVYAKLLLTKILTPFPTRYVDLQSPAGCGISVAVYNYDGDVYATDESRMLAEMGDRTFRLGNVHEHSHAQIFAGPVVQKLVGSTCVESLPGCSDCAFQTYCGSDPVFNYATQSDLAGHRPTSGFCEKNMAIIQLLFRLLDSTDRELQRILWSWVRSEPIPPLGEELCRN